jgi:hypothetical protein
MSATCGLAVTRTEIIFTANSGAKRLIRVILMWTHFSLIIYRAFEYDATYSFATKVHQSGSVRPYLQWGFNDTSNQASVLLLIWAFVGVIVDTLFLWPAHAFLTYHYAAGAVRKSYTLAQKQWSGVPRPLATVHWVLCTLLYIITFVIYHMVSSPFTSNLFNLAIFLDGTVHIFELRKTARECMSPNDRGGEDEMGFGQIVALVMLMSPIVASVDKWWDGYGNVHFWKDWWNGSRPGKQLRTDAGAQREDDTVGLTRAASGFSRLQEPSRARRIGTF